MVCGNADINEDYHHVCNSISDALAQIIVCGRWGTWSAGDDPVIWRRRDHNKEADFLANQAMSSRADINWTNPDVGALRNSKTSICGWCDGGSRAKDGVSASAWLLKAWLLEQQKWTVVAL
eukprot:3579498-Karenia_brevis.AAC.1